VGASAVSGITRFSAVLSDTRRGGAAGLRSIGPVAEGVVLDETDLPMLDEYLPAPRPIPLDSRRAPIKGLDDMPPDEKVRDLEAKGLRLRRLLELGKESRDGEGRGIEIRKGRSERSRGRDSTASPLGIRACAGLSGDLPVITAPKVGAGLVGRLRLGDETRFDQVQDGVAFAEPGETVS